MVERSKAYGWTAAIFAFLLTFCVLILATPLAFYEIYG